MSFPTEPQACKRKKNEWKWIHTIDETKAIKRMKKKASEANTKATPACNSNKWICTKFSLSLCVVLDVFYFLFKFSFSLYICLVFSHCIRFFSSCKSYMWMCLFQFHLIQDSSQQIYLFHSGLYRMKTNDSLDFQQRLEISMCSKCLKSFC